MDGERIDEGKMGGERIGGRGMDGERIEKEEKNGLRDDRRGREGESESQTIHNYISSHRSQRA